MPRPTDPFSQAGPTPDPRTKQTYLPPSIEKAREEHEQNAAQLGGTPPQVVSPSTPPAGLAPQEPGAESPQGGAVVSPTAMNIEGPEQPSPSPDQPYDFITNPAKPPKPSLMASIPGKGSMAVRVGLLAASLLVFLIIFTIFKGILSSGNKTTAAALLSVVQDQQEMIHIANGSAQQTLSSNHANFAATLQVGMGSSQSKLIGYITNNGQKVKTKQLGLKISTSTDNQLAAAVTVDTYDQTFQQVMQSKLDSYGTDIQQALKLEKGKKGRALLKDSYYQAQLLDIQLTSPAS